MLGVRCVSEGEAPAPAVPSGAAPGERPGGRPRRSPPPSLAPSRLPQAPHRAAGASSAAPRGGPGEGPAPRESNACPAPNPRSALPRAGAPAFGAFRGHKKAASKRPRRGSFPVSLQLPRSPHGSVKLLLNVSLSTGFGRSSPPARPVTESHPFRRTPAPSISN